MQESSGSTAGEFPLSGSLASRLIALPSCGSTNAELLRLAGDDFLPEFTTLVTLDQRDGRGRLNREWEMPAGAGLASSFVLRPTGATRERMGWVPLVAGLAVQRAVLAMGVPEPSLKWPNDVLVGGRKICGILAELAIQGGEPVVVLGVGLNLTPSVDELAAAGLPQATSLAAAGAEDVTPDRVLFTLLSTLREEFTRLQTAASTDVVRRRVERAMGAIGSGVRVDTGGQLVTGRAVGLDGEGRIRVETADGERVFSAGDVTHLRAEAADDGAA